MNFDRDFDAFSAALDDLWSLKGQVLNGGAQTTFFRALEHYPLREVRAGLDAHLRDPKRGQFLPMPADVIAQINGIVADDGRPGAEEAWSVAFRATNEADTVVWTDEIAAAFGEVRPLLLAGDEVAARMAFKEIYLRLLGEARDKRTSPRWSATLGSDPTARDAVLLPHVKAGRLPSDMLLGGPPPRLETLLSLPAPAGATEASVTAREKAKAALRVLRAEMAGRATGPSLAELDAKRTKQLKAEAAAKVALREASFGTETKPIFDPT